MNILDKLKATIAVIQRELEQPHVTPWALKLTKGIDDFTKVAFAVLAAYGLEQFRGVSPGGAALVSLGIGVVVIEFIFQTLGSFVRGETWPWTNPLRLFDKLSDSACWAVPFAILALRGGFLVGALAMLTLGGAYGYLVYQQGKIRASRRRVPA